MANRIFDNTIKLIFSKIKANFIKNTDVVETEELSIDTTPTTDSTNLVTSGGVKASLEDIREVAEGKTSSYVCTYADNPILNDQSAAITLTTNLVDTTGVTVPFTSLKKSDNILIPETDVPDRWCVPVYDEAGTTIVSVTLHKLETAKVPVNAVRNANSVSLVDDTGAAIIPTAVDGASEQPGMVKINSYMGVTVGTDESVGILQTVPADVSEITARSATNKVITPGNYDNAVKHALADAAGVTYTETEQTAARERLNAGAPVLVVRL